MQLDDSFPQWLTTLITLALGAGGVQVLKVWLENRRLGKKEYRETLLERVRELEAVISRMQKRMGNLRVEMAHLDVENQYLRKQLGCPERGEDNADGSTREGDDGPVAP